MTLASCMAAKPNRAEVAPEPTSQPVLASDPTMEAAVEMVFDAKYEQAAKLLDQLATGYEAANLPNRAAESAFWLGYCREKSGNFPEAAKQYRRVMEKYPQSEAARKAQDRLDGLGPQTPPPSTGPSLPVR